MALNAMAAQLLERARSSDSQFVAVKLVDDASALVSSTEAFELEAAAVLERVGRPDLAALRVESALRLAPRRQDLAPEIDRLRRLGVPDPKAARRRRGVLAAVAALGLFAVGTSAGLLISVPGGIFTGLGPTGSPPSSPAPTSVASPSPTPPPRVEPSDPVAAVRTALDAEPALAELSLSIEDVGDAIRIAGPVPDAATAATVREIAVGAAAGAVIDTKGLSSPPPPRYQVVQAGDTLWEMAARSYGDARRWPEIASANPDRDPRRLVVGDRILIPEPSD